MWGVLMQPSTCLFFGLSLATSSSLHDSIFHYSHFLKYPNKKIQASSNRTSLSNVQSLIECAWYCTQVLDLYKCVALSYSKADEKCELHGRHPCDTFNEDSSWESLVVTSNKFSELLQVSAECRQ